MFFKDKKMTRKDLEEAIREYKDFSKYTRKELEKELRVLLPDINLNEFSDQGVEDLLRSNILFLSIAQRSFGKKQGDMNASKSGVETELEEDYEKLEQPQSKVERYKTIRWILIAVLCAFLGYYFGSMNTELKYLEQRIEQLQQEVNLIEYQNEQLEDNVDTLSDIVDLIIIYITSDDLPEVENPGTSAEII